MEAICVVVKIAVGALSHSFLHADLFNEFRYGALQSLSELLRRIESHGAGVVRLMCRRNLIFVENFILQYYIELSSNRRYCGSPELWIKSMRTFASWMSSVILQDPLVANFLY